MEIINTDIHGVKLIQPQVFIDERGAFFESFQKKRYEFLETDFVQENCSISKKDVIRGMHFSNQSKLVGTVFGKILDIVVDLRQESPTFKKWLSFILDDENFSQLYIPQGLAHGFCVLSQEARVSYKVSEYYDPKKEQGFRYDDPEINIDWPINTPILSKKDQDSPFFSELELCLYG